MPSNLTAAPRLGNVLIERGYLTVEQLTAALDEQRSSAGKLLGEILIERSFCTGGQIIASPGLRYGVPDAKLECPLADPKIVDCLPREYIEKTIAFPQYKIPHTLTLAVTEPPNLFQTEE